MSQEAWCECDGALLRLSPFPWFSFHRWTSTLVPALIHHHASHLTCPRCTPTDIHAWTQHTYERAVSPDARDLNEKATTTKKVLFKKEHVSLFIHSWNEEKEAMTHTCTYTHCDESDIYQPGLRALKLSCILSQPCLCTSQAYLLILTALHPFTDHSMSLTAAGRSSVSTGHQPQVKSSILTFTRFGICEKTVR